LNIHIHLLRSNFLPNNSTSNPDLLATSSDYLRIYKNEKNGFELKSTLNKNKNSDYCAPITSFDWNHLDTNIIGTSSIDTTCTIWNIEAEETKTQLIAHDKEVYDISFSYHQKNVFGSVGADGSLRLFDLRNLEHSTILYENDNSIPLLRLMWNPNDANYIATILMDSNDVIIIDQRQNNVPLIELKGHDSAVNALYWSPHSSKHICTVGDDCQTLIWDINEKKKPMLLYQAKNEICQVQWSTLNPDWVGICSEKDLELLKV